MSGVATVVHRLFELKSDALSGPSSDESLEVIVPKRVERFGERPHGSGRILTQGRRFTRLPVPIPGTPTSTMGASRWGIEPGFLRQPAMATTVEVAAITAVDATLSRR